MPREKKEQLNISESEWKVMQVLWETPDLTLKEISLALAESKWSYTTIRTLVNRLVQKKAILAETKTAGTFRYRAGISEVDCKEKEASRFLNRVFEGSLSMLVSTMTKDSNLSEQERNELQNIIKKIKN